MPDAYTPIDCGLHDELQLRALRRRRVRARWHTGEGRVEEDEVTPVDVLTRDGAEWLVLDDGRRIRLDRLEEVDGVVFQDGGPAC